MRVHLHGGPKDGEEVDMRGTALEMVGYYEGRYRTGRYEFIPVVTRGDRRCLAWKGWNPTTEVEAPPNIFDWRAIYGQVTISNQLLREEWPAADEPNPLDWRPAVIQFNPDLVERTTVLTEWSPDQGGGVLLEELLDQSTLDWLEKVKAKDAP
jgi:hypothetical protein